MRIHAQNPFTPTFGRVPYALVGRDELIDDVIEGLANQPGDPNRATIFIGPRGSGKTVLLSSIAEEAARMGWVYAKAVARTGFRMELVEDIRKRAGHLISEESQSDVTSLTLGPISVGRELRPLPPVSWRFVFESIIEELAQHNVGLLFCIDEVDPTCDDLIEFIGDYQMYVTDNRDVALLLSGLPSRVSDLLMDEHVSFIRRAFQRYLDPIDLVEVREALRTTIEDAGKQIDEDALEAAAEVTKGLAFAVQLVGYRVWRSARDVGRITMAEVEHALVGMEADLEHSIIAPTLRELSPRELDYLRAMAQDEGDSSTSEVAQRMGIGNTNGANLRRRLIDRGVISSPRMGLVRFETPMLRDYLLRHPDVA
jgi:hypothetical protein